MTGALSNLWKNPSGQMYFLHVCPWDLLRQPAVVEAANAQKWFDKNQLNTRYPDPPLFLLRAVEAFDNGINRGQHDRFERERKEREAKSKAK
jgi:hypothetical protein